MDGFDPALTGVQGAAEMNSHPIQQDFAFIRDHRTAKDLDQRAFACTIVADKREHFACSQFQVSAIERRDVAIALNYPTCL